MFSDIRNGRAVVSWNLNEVGEPFVLGRYRALSVQVSGEFFGGRVTIEGTNETNEDAQYFVMNDPNGNPLVFMAPRGEQILEDCVAIAPKFTGDNPKSTVKVSILLAQVR